MALISLIPASIPFFIPRGGRQYSRPLYGLSWYIFWPFGKCVQGDGPDEEEKEVSDDAAERCSDYDHRQLQFQRHHSWPTRDRPFLRPTSSGQSHPGRLRPFSFMGPNRRERTVGRTPPSIRRIFAHEVVQLCPSGLGPQLRCCRRREKALAWSGVLLARSVNAHCPHHARRLHHLLGAGDYDPDGKAPMGFDQTSLPST